MLMNRLNALSRTKIVFIYNNKTQRQHEWKRKEKIKIKLIITTQKSYRLTKMRVLCIKLTPYN